MKFPNLKPTAIDAASLKPPVVVNEKDVKPEVARAGGMMRWLLTEANAECKYVNMGIFTAEPGKGSDWQTHPAQAQEEGYLYVIEGQGTVLYKQGNQEHRIAFQEGDALFPGHLTHRIWNDGGTPLKMYISVAALPMRTIVHEEIGGKVVGCVDSVEFAPPRLVRPAEIPETPFTSGGLINLKMLTPETVGARNGRFGTALERPGTGSTWHTHPPGEEDLFYVCRGKGTMFYLQAGQVHSFEFREGDGIHSHHLTNYTMNHTDRDLFMVFSGAQNPPRTIIHELA